MRAARIAAESSRIPGLDAAMGPAVTIHQRPTAGWSREAVRKSVESRKTLARARTELVRPYVHQARVEGHHSTRQIAAFLNARGIRTTRNKMWNAAQVSRLLARLDSPDDDWMPQGVVSSAIAQIQYPNWPAMMRDSLAALYCGLSAQEFDREVAAGRLPAARRLGDTELWSRAELDRSLNELAC